VAANSATDGSVNSESEYETRDVGALYGYASSLLSLCFQLQPTHVVACMDNGRIRSRTTEASADTSDESLHQLPVDAESRRQLSELTRRTLQLHRKSSMQQQQQLQPQAVEEKVVEQVIEKERLETIQQADAVKEVAQETVTVTEEMVVEEGATDEHPDESAYLQLEAVSSFRHLIKDYKEHRPPTEDALRWQLHQLPRVSRALGIRAISMLGYEADDIIGTLAARASTVAEGEDEPPFDRVIILSNDKDFVQCINERVSLLRPVSARSIRAPLSTSPSDLDTSSHGILPGHGAPYVWVHESDAINAFGVAPSRFVDFLVLRGDEADGIPGVPGIGEKRARDLLHKYPSIEAMLADQEGPVGTASKKKKGKVMQKIAQGLQECAALFPVWRHLALIRTDVHGLPQWDQLQYHGPTPSNFHAHTHSPSTAATDAITHALADAGQSAPMDDSSIHGENDGVDERVASSVMTASASSHVQIAHSTSALFHELNFPLPRFMTASAMTSVTISHTSSPTDDDSTSAAAAVSSSATFSASISTSSAESNPLHSTAAMTMSASSTSRQDFTSYLPRLLTHAEWMQLTSNDSNGHANANGNGNGNGNGRRSRNGNNVKLATVGATTDPISDAAAAKVHAVVHA